VSLKLVLLKEGYSTKKGTPWFAKKETKPEVLELHFLKKARVMTGLPLWETSPVLPYPFFDKIITTDMKKKSRD